MKTPLPKTSAPAERAFKEVGINCLEDLSRFTLKELSSLHGVGPKVIRILKEELAKRGLNFKS